MTESFATSDTAIFKRASHDIRMMPNTTEMSYARSLNGRNDGQRIMIGRALIGTTLGVAVMLASASTSIAAQNGQDDQSLTPAQVALFDSNHLKDITKPVRLEYAFSHQGGVGDFKDTITADIRDVRSDGRKDVSVQFLSGTRQVKFPPAMGFNGNPLLMYFLEHDVVEMQQATGGNAGYFRNLIRAAFLDADMHPTKVAFKGRTYDGHEIVISPFRQDSHLAQFPAFRDKTYHFILCDGLPGTIYQISTTVPTVGNGISGAFKEAMTYEGEKTP